MKLPVVGVMLALLLGLSGVAEAAQVHAPAPDRHQPRVVAMDVGCAYTVLAAKALGVPLCPNPPEPMQVTDTIPGTAGNPSPQVITVQGCTGCIGIGGGGGGGASYNAAFGQANTASSYTGIAAYDFTNGNTDALVAAPFGGNAGGTGYPAAYNQPGILVVQGGLQGGAIAISGTLLGTYTSVGSSTPQVMSTANPGFQGIGGSAYSGAANTSTGTDTFNPAHVSVNGNQYTFPGSEQAAFPAWTTTGQTATIYNTGGASVMAIDLPTISAGTATLVATEDDGGGTFIWQPFCVRNDGTITSNGTLALSTSTTYSWICNLAPHSQIKLTLTSSGSPASFTTSYTLGNAVANNTSKGATATLRNNNGAATGYACSQHASATLTTTTLNNVIPLVSSKTLYICSITASAVGTNPTLTVSMGNNTTCSTGTVNAGTQLIGTSPQQFMPTTAGGYALAPTYAAGLCLTGGGTITDIYVSILFDQI